MSTTSSAVVNTLVSVLEKWSAVDTVGLVLSGEDRYDPYFIISLDAYCTGEVPAADERAGAFGDVIAFETSAVTPKDRFLIDSVPVRIEYKRTDRFDELVTAARDGEPRFRDAGTYAFHRLQNAEIVFARSDWVERVREGIEDLPDRFWSQLCINLQARAEHVYSDLSAAAARQDPLYYSISSGSFVTAICTWLFAINRQFEPSSRHLSELTPELPIIPDSFPANLDNLVRQENGLSLGQRRELAELMVTSLLSLQR